MTDEEIINSGVFYYECPLCKKVLNSCFERESFTDPLSGFFYCPKCDKKFFARHRYENIITASEQKLPLFEKHSSKYGKLYTLKKMQFGKVMH